MSLEKPDEFWNEHANIIDWYSKWDKVLDDSNPPFFRWFTNGKLNVTYNALDRHLKSHRRNKAAFIWVGESGKEKIVTYHGLLKRVNAFAKALQDAGLKKGDKIAIYMPMIIEATVAMLGAARIGVAFTLVFSGFGANALADRITDCGAKIVVTADGANRGGKLIDLKKIVDEAVELASTVEEVIVVRNTENKVEMVEGRDYWYHEITADQNVFVEPERMDSNDALFILYTSGTTGKPKGVVHGNGGYSVWVANTLKWAFNPQEDDRWWCAADIGWVTGHSYIVFAPLLLGLTSVIYEGAINYPEPDRMWDIIERYGVNLLYTSPTAIRMLMRYGDLYPAKHDLDSLRVLGTVGEPINPAAWQWYFKTIGKSRCPIVDTYWQTETGGFIISPATQLGVGSLKPGSATFPMPGIDPVILDEAGKELGDNTKGFIAIKRPWPGLMLGLNNDPERYKSVYFSKFPGKYYNGDYAMRDSDGYYWLLGRADEVIKVSGHRIGTIEIEDALVSMKEVAESAVFGKPDAVKGEAVVAFVITKEGVTADKALIEKLKKGIRETMGPILVPDEIHFVKAVPKTRSGKIMRRVVKAVYTGQIPGDVSTLENEASVAEIQEAINILRKQSEK
ncbi:MAG: acetate--CoA ligase [Candidatus Thermoplasmatota archaeon]|nr:acetate--CoA ligase [Candidatus Thermoplasmatota archaeon]MCL5888389.1 acetate--CoA ligase [Candidatus Thermoplasmatota archaeon]